MKNIFLFFFLSLAFPLLAEEEFCENPLSEGFVLIEDLDESFNIEKEDDPNINASMLALESLPTAVVAGCVSAITGDYFDHAVDLVLPGPQPLVVQHTFSLSGQHPHNIWCRDLLLKKKWHFLHMPELQIEKSKYHLNGIYQDDNGSSFPYRRRLYEKDQDLKLASKALDHLTNLCGGEISGKTKWGNSYLTQVKEEEYQLNLGSGAKRTFISKKPGKKSGKFYLTREKCPNGNQYVYEYNKDQELTRVKALNSQGELLARLKIHQTKKGILWTLGEMKSSFTFEKNKVTITPTHSIPSSYEIVAAHSRPEIQKNYPEKRSLKIALEPYKSNHQVSFRVKSLQAPVGVNESLIPIYSRSS